jgi:Heavy metal binding domain
MDPDVRMDKPGFCPRCGMKLVLKVPDPVEFAFEVSQAPELLRPQSPITLTFRVIDPRTGEVVKHFDIVHEKLMHLFLVSENLEFFLHDHPVLQPDGTFTLTVRLPFGGMYRMLADYYPSQSVPQLSVNTLFVSGEAGPPHLAASLAPCKSENLVASLQTDPSDLIAGLESRLLFTLEPADGLEPYLGAWGHMLAVSEDLVDLLHLHPFLTQGAGGIQFNAIFPRPGLYRIWTQFQRKSVVNTVVFTVPVKSL